MSGYPLAVPLVIVSHRIRIRCNHTMVIRGEAEKGEAISGRDKENTGDTMGLDLSEPA